jgi:hypothetical protein
MKQSQPKKLKIDDMVETDDFKSNENNELSALPLSADSPISPVSDSDSYSPTSLITGAMRLQKTSPHSAKAPIRKRVLILVMPLAVSSTRILTTAGLTLMTSISLHSRRWAT